METVFKLVRKTFKIDRTLGEFYYPGETKPEGFILEDQVRKSGIYVYGETAIPTGRYRIITTFSNRFGKVMIQLVNIRGGNILFGDKPIDAAGIRIHGGNGPLDTLGCPLLGAQSDHQTEVHNCSAINEKLLAVVIELGKTQEVYLDVINDGTPVV